MSYVALSRCLSQKGLYVMNFNPAKVLASEKACKEYSRLLGTGRMNHNQGCKNRKLERYWYTTNVIRKATGATAEKIRQTAADKQSTVGAVPKTSKKGRNAKKSKTKAQSVLGKRQAPDNAIPGMKSDAPKQKPTSSTIAESTSNVIVTNEFYREFDYFPVDETWQRTICNAFGWPFIASSRGIAINDAHLVNSRTRPRTTKIVGDGNCWFRAIAHIVTGEEKCFSRVKKSVLAFMEANVHVLQNIYESYPVLQDAYSREIPGPFNGDFAKKVINYHRRPSVWARNVIMEMTAVMLNTKWYLYSPNRIWSSIDAGHYLFWFRRAEMTSYPSGVDVALIPNLGEQSLYINHRNGSHFETCHTGLIGI